MDIPKFLSLAAEFETRMSTLYRTIADRSKDESIAERLKILAREELNHANAIRRGKRNYEDTPDEPHGITLSSKDAWAVLEEIMAFQAALGESTPPLSEQLKKMLAIEKRLEKIHMETLERIESRMLKRLFIKLSKSNQSHILMLIGLVESLGENTQ